MRAAALACVLGVAACGGRADTAGPLNLGYLPNITHAQALVGGADGTYARLIPSGVRMRAFPAGTEAAEALLSKSLDASYLGAGPALIAFLRSEGNVVVVAGAASGGSVLVARSARTPEQLAGGRVATPQIGNTQDIAMRDWLARHGVEARIFPMANPDIVNAYRRGQLDGAWVPEPWGARLLAEGAHVMVDERTLWPKGHCPTTVLVVRRSLFHSRPGDVRGLLAAHRALTARWQADAKGFEAAVNTAYAGYSGRALPDALLRDAFSRLEPAGDLMTSELRTEAEHARALGYLPQGDLTGLTSDAPADGSD